MSVFSLSAIGARRAAAGAALGVEPLAALDLDHAARDDVAHRRLALAERGEGDAGAGGLEAGERGPRAVDRVDDQDELRAILPGRDHPPILGVEGHLRRVGGDPAGEERLGLGVDRERHVAAHALARVCAAARRAEPREHDLAQRVREIEGDVSHPAGLRRAESGRSPSSSSTSRLSPSRHSSTVTFWPGSKS